MRDIKISMVLGDSLEILKTLPDNFIDLLIADPPYGIREGNRVRARNGRRKVKQKNGGILLAKTDQYDHGDWDDAPPPKELFDEMIRTSKNQIIWGVNNYNYYFGPGRIIWDKMNGETDFSDAEIAYCSLINSTRIVRYMWNGMMQGQAIESPRPIGDKRKNEKRIHKTQKPVILYKWLLDNFAKEGNLIADTHGGSNSLGNSVFGLWI